VHATFWFRVEQCSSWYQKKLPYRRILSEIRMTHITEIGARKIASILVVELRGGPRGPGSLKDREAPSKDLV